MNRAYPNVFAAGIAFAPPHAISRPNQTPSGAPVASSPPRLIWPSHRQAGAGHGSAPTPRRTS